jgi:hypothetical protein
MAKGELKNVFLSASVPFEDRHPKYFESADIIAIRDAVIALVTAVLPKHRLIWGGHPSITPIIYYVMELLGLNVQEHVVLYQSKFFEHLFPEDNNRFKNVILTEKQHDLQSSINLMRERMFSENFFSAGVFIGGMEGIEDEYKSYTSLFPKSVILPIASTGAAAKIVFENLPIELREDRLVNDYGYMSVFQDLLLSKI